MTFGMIPFWKRFADAPPPFSATYVLGAWIGVPILWTIAWWFLLGMPGFRDLLKDRLRATFVLLLLLLAGWAALSWHWAFMRADRPDVAVGAALQLALVVLFVLVLACAAPSPRLILLVIIVSAALSALVGAMQVAQHHSIGLYAIGEVPLNPLKGGTSVIQSGARRWLRPYGLTVHPNLLAGFLAVALLGLGAFILSRRSFRWSVIVFWGVLWVFFLTFSRGAWIGFSAGAVVLLVLLLRHLQQGPEARARRWRAGVTLVGAVALGAAFLWLYHPLLLARTGIIAESTEARSINERVIYSNIADIAVQEYPLIGLGSGNFPWYASYYLFYRTDLDMRGDNVHQVYLYAHAELGIVGILLVYAALIVGFEAALRTPPDSQSMYRYAMLAGVVACGFIGLVDHYFWTIVNYQVLWWGLLALSARR